MTYLISDAQGNLVSFDTKLFGIAVRLPAIFIDEDQALQILFKLESENLLTTPHKVLAVDDALVVTPMDFASRGKG